MAKWQYTKGLQDLGNNSDAWLQPDKARERHDAGMNEAEATHDISLAPYHDRIDAERIIVNIHTLYKDFGAPRKADAPDYHALMARLRINNNIV